jgi:hypothetical protein
MRRTSLAVIVLLLVLGISAVAWMLSLEPCAGQELPMGLPIGSLGPYYAVTDQGRLYPGRTYRYMNEGPWVGDMTLVFASPKLALVVVRYPADYPKNTLEAMCRAFFP